MNKELMKLCVTVSSNAAVHAGHKFDDKKHLFFLTLALCGETGELANIVKKVWRDKNSTSDEKLFDELADVYIYLSLIAYWCGIDLDVRATEKMEEVKTRPFAQAPNKMKLALQDDEFNEMDTLEGPIHRRKKRRDGIALQNAEFDAMDALIKSYKRCVDTPVVDDDYPEMRHYYESSLKDFIDALKNNRGERLWK